MYESTRTILNLERDIEEILNGEQTSENHQVHFIYSNLTNKILCKHKLFIYFKY